MRQWVHLCLEWQIGPCAALEAHDNSAHKTQMRLIIRILGFCTSWGSGQHERME